MAGVSNADTGQIRLADQILGGRLVSVQNQFSPAFRSNEAELRLCDELNIAFLPWSPLGGISRAGELGSAHGAFARVAERHGVSPQQVCLAWMLAKSPVVVPIPGSSRPETARDSAAAAELLLDTAELAELAAAGHRPALPAAPGPRGGVPGRERRAGGDGQRAAGSGQRAAGSGQRAAADDDAPGRATSRRPVSQPPCPCWRGRRVPVRR
jgi:diketogulonate reductase-like aldo/keto reductase